MRPVRLARELVKYPSNFSRMLLGPAIRTRSQAGAWRRDLAAQLSWREVYEKARFSRDLSVNQTHCWWGSFRDRRDGIEDYLELGSWEGQSAVFAAWLFPRARTTAVDWFANPDANANFDFNTQPFADRLEKIAGTSWDVLRRLAAEGRRFDMIYIDADHRFDTVLMDTILSWPLLRTGGFLIWDDYLWSLRGLPSRLNPKLAIDTWLRTRSPLVKVVYAGWQVCVQKIGEDPEVRDMSGRLAWTGLAESPALEQVD